MLEMYFEEIWIRPEDEETFELIKSNFSLDDEFPSDIEFHDFSFTANKRKYNNPKYTPPLISENRRYAVFYQEQAYRKGLCESGVLVLTEKRMENGLRNQF